MTLVRVLLLLDMKGNRFLKAVVRCDRTILLRKTIVAMNPYRMVGRVGLAHLLVAFLSQMLLVVEL
jgi:hypothetical protein